MRTFFEYLRLGTIMDFKITQEKENLMDLGAHMEEIHECVEKSRGIEEYMVKTHGHVSGHVQR